MTRGTVLLTGATGFIGSNLARRLVQDGWQVHAVTRAGSSRALLEGLEQVRAHEHDGTTENLIAIVKAVQPVAVFHLASLFLAQHTPADVSRLVRSNMEFPAQLAEALAQNGVRMLVNAGTSWQHFENQAYNPVCLYAALKQSFEAVLRFYVETAGLRVITLKLFDTYGPGDPRPKLMNLLQRLALEGTRLDMSPGEQLIDLVYVDDVVDAFITALERLQSGADGAMEEYGISSGSPLPLKDIAAAYARVSGRTLDIAWGTRPYRPREVMRPWSAFATLPGWRAKVGLADGIARCLQK